VISNKLCDLCLLHWVGGGGSVVRKIYTAPSLSELWDLEAQVHKTTFGLLIETALYVMLLMRTNPLLGQVGEGEP
jgi:hypothetical protein